MKKTSSLSQIGRTGLRRTRNLSKSQLIVFILAFAAIGYAIFRSLAAAPLVASIEAEQMSLPSQASVISDSSASGGQAIQMLANGTASGSVNFPSSVSSLTVLARGDQCFGTPAMTIAVDSSNLLTNTAVSAASWTAYTVTLSSAIAAGGHSLSISFTNDYLTNGSPIGKSGKFRPGCDRNLYIDVTNFYGPTTVTLPPTVTLSATPTSVSAGQSATLTWASTNASACTASGAWSGNEPTSGSTTTGAINQNSTYSLTCTGAGGSASASTTVTVSTTSSMTINDLWYQGGSNVWNTPIPSNVTIHPDSASMITKWAPQGTNSYNYYWLGPRGGPGLGAASAVAYPTSSTSAVTIQINFPNCADHTVSVPIPSNTIVMENSQLQANSRNENKLAVMLPNGDEWDFFDIVPPGAVPYHGVEGVPSTCTTTYTDRWQASEAVQHSPGWTGDGSWHQSYGWSDSNIPFGAGLLRQRDLQSTPTGGNWGHALIIDYSANCSSGQTHPPFVYPATSSDGVNTGLTCAPMGARFQLDPSIDCNTWPSMVNEPEWIKQMCRTFQVYGGITGHSATSQGAGDGIWTEYYLNPNARGYYYPWQDPSTGAWPSYYSTQLDLPYDLLSHFRVVDWRSWTGQ